MKILTINFHILVTQGSKLAEDDKNAKDFIRPSTFKVSTSILIARKPRDGLCICVDYRALNAIIDKSRYFISLINETLVKLSKAKIFIKLDVIHAFNRIKIKEEHE
jgi:hypothetical protein